MKTGVPVSQIGIDGALVTLAPLLLLLAFTGTQITGLTTLGTLAELELWRFGIGAISAFFGVVFGLRLFKPGPGAKLAGAIAAIGSALASLPYLMQNPFAALFSAIFLIGFSFVIVDFEIPTDYYHTESQERRRQEAWWSAFSLPLALLISLVPGVANTALSAYIMLLCLGIAQYLFTRWALLQESRRYLMVPGLIALGAVAILGLFIAESSSYLSSIAYVWALTLLSSFVSLLALPRNHFFFDQNNTSWDLLLNHPARMRKRHPLN